MEILNLIKRRRSIRRYTSAAVGDAQVRLLLEAAMAAPSGHDRQPVRFVVVRQEDTREALAETHEFSSMIRQAPVAIAVCADPRGAVHWLEDACVAAQNLLLAATALELGAVWVAVYPHAEHEEFVRGVLEIPEPIKVICLIPVGHPDEEKAARTRYDPDKVHFERYGQG